MADFLTTTGTSAAIEKILLQAKEIVLLCSPYLQFSKIFYERLREVDDRDIQIIIIYGKKELSDREYELISSIRNVELFYLEELHAKCYRNEQTMVITSMNFYEYSQKNNREMGILIEKDKDSAVFEDACKEIESIIKASSRERGSQLNPSLDDYKPHPRGDIGICIRCGAGIKRDKARPYCWRCFNSWVEFENPRYEEQFCHVCGRPTNSSMNMPVCFSCSQSGF